MPPSLPGPFLHLLIHFSQEYFSLSRSPVSQVFWRITHPKTARPPNPCFTLSHRGSQHLLSKPHLQKKKKKRASSARPTIQCLFLLTRGRGSASLILRGRYHPFSRMFLEGLRKFQMIKNGLWNSVRGSRLSTSQRCSRY